MRKINNPTHLRIKNNTYELRTDFRNWINYSQLCQDDSICFTYKIDPLLKLAFKQPIAEDLQDVFSAIAFFLTCGQTMDLKDNDSNQDIVFDYKIDHQRIKAGFYRQYGFNPWNFDYFHWWDFKACLDDLQGSTLENMIQIRQLDLKNYKGTQKAKMQSLKEAYKIKGRANKQQEENNRQLNDILINGSPEEIANFLGGQ